MNTNSLSHLTYLESESIEIMREVFAEAINPVMLYSIGKDSAVMLHLARKAFLSVTPPISITSCRYNLEIQRYVQLPR